METRTRRAGLAPHPPLGAAFELQAVPFRADPCFSARREEGGLVVRGDLECRLGCRMEPSALGLPEGVFLRWSWDGAALDLETDRYGLYPVYFYWDGAQFAVSPSLEALLRAGVPARLDEEALGVFLRLGYFVGEDTPFRGVRRLRAGARLRFDGDLLLEGAFRFRPLVRIPYAEAVDGYVELFRASLGRCLEQARGAVAVPLSGGKDSRHIFLEMCARGRRPDFALTARHYPPRNDHDVLLAGELTRRCGVPHVVVGQDRPWVEARMRTNLVANFCSDEHTWAWAVSDALRGRAQTVLDGLAGDSLSDSHYLNEENLRLLDAAGPRGLARKYMERGGVFNEPAMRLLLRPEVLARMDREAAEERFIREYERSADQAHSVDAFFFLNKTRNKIALLPLRIYDQSHVILTPYLGHELHDFLRSLPLEHLLPRTLHRDAIARACPDFADVPFEVMEEDCQCDRDLSLRFCRAVAGKALRAPRSRLMRRGAVSGRLACGSLLPSYGSTTRWFTPMALYLLQLEDCVRRAEGGAA